MSDKSIVMKAFLNQFTEFVEDIQSVFPDNADIDSAKTALFLMKKTNPRMLLSTWITFIAEPYGAQIEKGDIGFFLEKDYTQDLEYMGNAVMQKVDTLSQTSTRDGTRKSGQNHEIHSKFDETCGASW